MRALSVLSFLPFCLTSVHAAEHPAVDLSNGLIHARLYLPDAGNGFYRGTRFDWSGVIYSLEFQGHNFYGPWFQRTRPDIHDFVYEGGEVVAGPCSAVTGPADEFAPLGFEDAKPGGTFVKIGVGALRKTEAAKYDNYNLYEIADGGKWTMGHTATNAEFTQHLPDAGSGYAYIYTKSMRLIPGKPEMVLSHTLKNTGKLPIHTTVYNHNFLTLDRQPPGPGMTIALPFAIQAVRPLPGSLAEVRGKIIAYTGTLKDRDTVATQIKGFGPNSSDSRIRIEDTRRGAGMTIETDRPLMNEFLWSIRTVVAVEPFIAIDIEPGAEFAWETNYRYETLQKSAMSHATGSFEVKLSPQTTEVPNLGRMAIDKQFRGELDGSSKGEMLSVMGEVKGSAGYVAMELVTGTLHGKSGSFVLQHRATMTRGVPELSVTVVPDSGTGELKGLSGKMNIDIREGQHFYTFDYQLNDYESNGHDLTGGQVPQR